MTQLDNIVDPRMVSAPAGAGYQRYREMTIDDMLLENRVIFLVGEINFRTASEVIMKMLYLQSIKKGQDIHMYINCLGGTVDDTLAIYDTMQYINCDVGTYCVGRAVSGAALILTAGAKGKRFCLPHAKIMIHQPWGGITGQAADIEIHAEAILKDKRLLTSLFAKHTDKPFEQVAEETERDRYLSPVEAKEYGLVDEILEEQKKEDKKK